MLEEEDAKLLQFLDSEGYSFLREVPDQGICGINQLLTTTAIFCDLDYTGYGNRYCFKDPVDAVLELAKWDGITEPTGYIAKR